MFRETVQTDMAIKGLAVRKLGRFWCIHRYILGCRVKVSGIRNSKIGLSNGCTPGGISGHGQLVTRTFLSNELRRCKDSEGLAGTSKNSARKSSRLVDGEVASGVVVTNLLNSRERVRPELALVQE